MKNFLDKSKYYYDKRNYKKVKTSTGYKSLFENIITGFTYFGICGAY